MDVGTTKRKGRVMRQDGKEKKIQVIAYSGYKANERPLKLLLNKKELKVKRVLCRWAEPDHDFFKILAEDERVYRIKWQRCLDVWILEKIVEHNGET